MDAGVLVKDLAVVERYLLELLEAALELAELRQPAATLVLDVRLDLADPLALKLDALRDNLLLEPESGEQPASAGAVEAHADARRTAR